MDPVLEKIVISGYEEVYKVTEQASGLVGIIAIHSTKMGPALGGLRVYPYPTFDAALYDVLRLSKGMTYKTLLADAHCGGGKSVMIWDPKKQIPRDMLLAFGKAVEKLKGRYYTAEDSGTTQRDLLIVNEATRYIVGLEKEGSSGNPCAFTAWGTFHGIRATIHELTGSDSLEGKTIAIQGLGGVGMILAELLFWHGAKLIVTDVSAEKVSTAVKRWDAIAVEPAEIFSMECDVLAPCALGGAIHPKTIEKLQCLGIAGCANNQLSSPEDAKTLKRKGILYAPDYVINSGGVINVHFELTPVGYKPQAARRMIANIYDRLQEIFSLAKEYDISTDEAAMRLATQMEQQVSA